LSPKTDLGRTGPFSHREPQFHSRLEGTSAAGRAIGKAGDDIVKTTAKAGDDVVRTTVTAGNDTVVTVIKAGRDVAATYEKGWRDTATQTQQSFRDAVDAGKAVARFAEAQANLPIRIEQVKLR
jgi:hypothetical protein